MSDHAALDGGEEIGWMTRQVAGWMAYSRVDNERKPFYDAISAVLWLKQLWTEYRSKNP